MHMLIQRYSMLIELSNEHNRIILTTVKNLMIIQDRLIFY